MFSDIEISLPDGYLHTILVILTNVNILTHYLRLVATLIILTVNGVVISKLIFKSKNIFFTIGSGIIGGFLGYLAILSLMSYIFKGSLSIIIYFFIFTLISLTLKRKHRVELKTTYNSIRNAFRKRNFKLFLTLFYISLFIIYANTSGAGGDVTTHWGVASSFARGNYPTVSSWQPDYLIAYHEGAFMMIGALSVLSGLNVGIIHFVFAASLVTAIFLFITGVAQELKSSNISFLPAILGIIGFGGPIFLSSGFRAFFNKFAHLSPVEIINNLDRNPIFINVIGVKDIGGNSWGSFDTFYYVTFRTFGLACFLIFIYILSNLEKISLFKKYFLATLVVMLTLSIDESIAPAMAIFLGIHYLFTYCKMRFKGFIKPTIFLIVFSVICFFVFQNTIRDTFLNPKPDFSKIEFITNYPSELTSRINLVKSSFFGREDYGETFWYLPNILVLLIIPVVSLFLKINKFTKSLINITILTLITGFLIVDATGPWVGRRIILSAYQFLMFIFGFLLLEYKNSKQKRISLIIFFAVFGLQLIVAHADIFHHILTRKEENLIYRTNVHERVLEFIVKNIPYNKSVIFADGYPIYRQSSDLTLHAIQDMGIFSPIGPAGPKVLNAEPYGEYYDASINISPNALNKLNVNYIWIDKTYEKLLPELRKNQLANKDFFTDVYNNQDGKLLLIKPEYKKLDEGIPSLYGMIGKVEYGKSVYVGKFGLSAARGVILALSRQTEMYVTFEGSGNYFVLTEQKMPVERLSNKDRIKNCYNYLFLDTKENANSIFGCKYKKVEEVPGVVFWEKDTS